MRLKVAVLGVGVALAMAIAAQPAAATLTCHTAHIRIRHVRHEWRRVLRHVRHRRKRVRVRIRVRVVRWHVRSLLRCGLPETGPVGSTLFVENGTLAVSANVVDPAEGALAAPESGKRFVAVSLTLSDVGGEPVSGNANVDFAVLATDHQTHLPVFEEVAGCTNFAFGDFILAAGETAAGCVMFELPYGVDVTQVRFGPAEYGTLQAVWR